MTERRTDREPTDGDEDEPGGEEASGDASGRGPVMADVRHEPPTDGTDRAYERGNEGRDDE
ncbi:MAG: hypothetical protein ABEH56_06725 [Salinirussus sp.]